MRGSGPRLAYVLTVGFIVTGLGSIARSPAQDQEVPEDTQDFFEFLGSPEADSDLWNTVLDSVPDRPEESLPEGTELTGVKGVDQ